MRQSLQNITIKGFKTLSDLQDFQPGSLTVLIGPNGAGKSNFISFFRMLSWALSSPGNLQIHVAQLGGANMLLHDGSLKTREVEADLTVETTAGKNQYSFRLVFAAGDTLIYAEEKFRFSRKEGGFPTPAPWKELGAGHRESLLIGIKYNEEKTAKTIFNLLRKIIVYQFHNPSDTARIRGKWNVEDNRWLKEDGANLAPVLLRLKKNENRYYQRIVESVRLILPFFADFELESENGGLLLCWRERNSDRIFNASQAADGMLRIMALITLLLQPEEALPGVLILDEPELGLHPYAINLIGGLIRAASTKTQVIIATQSMPLIDCFEPKDIVVVERHGRESKFQRLDGKALEEWLKNYSISELWEKNVIGGRP